jgi:hypothetical protein
MWMRRGSIYIICDRQNTTTGQNENFTEYIPESVGEMDVYISNPPDAEEDDDAPDRRASPSPSPSLLLL